MKPRTRTLLAIALFVPAAAILLVTFACLPAPVGDPDQSKVDDTLTGAWQGVPAPADAKDAADNKQVAVALLRPWDGKTYYLQYLYSQTKDGKNETDVLNYKAWLVPLAGTTFITCEALDNSDYLAPGTDADRYYWVAKIERKGDMLTATPISEDAPFFKDLKTRDKIEAAIKDHINDKDLFGNPMTFKKLGKDDVGTVQSLRAQAKLGLENGFNNPGKVDIQTTPPTTGKGMP